MCDWEFSDGSRCPVKPRKDFVYCAKHRKADIARKRTCIRCGGPKARPSATGWCTPCARAHPAEHLKVRTKPVPPPVRTLVYDPVADFYRLEVSAPKYDGQPALVPPAVRPDALP